MTAPPSAYGLSSGSRRSGARIAGTPDRGSGVVWVVAMIALVSAMALTATSVGGAVVTRHRASSAADFSALAAADAVAHAVGDPCAVAEMVAERYGASLTACEVDGMEVGVEVELPLGGLAGGGRTAVVRARAGPP